MKTQPITPARIDFGDGSAPPGAPDFGDVYHPRNGPLAQARHVFLQGNGLPARWAGRDRFVVLETGFGLGNNFLATWQAWREDPQRCERLFFVSVERHPLRLDDLRLAHVQSPMPELAQALINAWPPLTPNLHALDFEGSRVQLLLAFGDVDLLLPALRVQADAFYLDGFAPAHNPQMWRPHVLKALGRKAAPGATLATWSVATDLHAGLLTAGFQVHSVPDAHREREITQSHFRPAHVPPPQPETGAVHRARHAIVVGAGVAGAAAAQALAQLGLQVTVLEGQAQPAMAASGNPAGLFHGTLNPDDGPYARLFRAATLHAQRDFAAKRLLDPDVASTQGLLRVAPEAGGLAAMQRQIESLGLPADYIQALDAEAASALAGVTLASPAWHYSGGGWLQPARWVALALSDPLITVKTQGSAERLQRVDDDWQVLDANGFVLAQAPLLVLACTADSARLVTPWCDAHWPLRATQGQVTHWRQPLDAQTVKLPVAGDGYAIPLPGGGLLCGATRVDADVARMAADTPVSTEAHVANLLRLARLTGLQPPVDASAIDGRTAYRLHTDDRLPIAGAMPLRDMPAGQRRDQARLLPREKGLFVLTALGARGLTLAPLLGRLVAAQATGTPWPLEQDLADAVDPARWLVRAARRQ